MLVRLPSAMSGPSAPQQIACLSGGLPNLHAPRHSDCKGRTATGFALDGDIASHHLTEAAADHEPKPSPAVLAGGRRGSLCELLEQFAYLLLSHSYAGIRNGDGDPLASVFLRLARINGNGTALRKL